MNDGVDAEPQIPMICATGALKTGPVRIGHIAGDDFVLVTGDTDNEGSRRAIEKNGGVYEDTREGKLRYWVPAATS